MHPIKYVWVLRAIGYKLFFKKVGLKTYIGKPMFVSGAERISIGSRTRIFPGMRMEAIGEGSIEIGNNTVIEQNVHIIAMNEALCIGNDVTIAPNVYISNVNHDYQDINRSVMDQKHIVKRTSIGNGCFIGYGAAVQAGSVLGAHCVVGANSVVIGEFPDNCVIVGSPAHIIKRYVSETGTWEKER